MQRTAADQILRELQNNPDMWLQVMHILQNTQNLNTKFFALQVSFFNYVLCLRIPLPSPHIKHTYPTAQVIQELRLFSQRLDND